MEKIRASNPEKSRIVLDSFGVMLVIATVAICAIDLWSHTNGGVVDGATNPERRKILVEFFGPLARNIGNMAFTAILSALAVLSRRILESISSTETAKSSIKNGLIGILATIIALNVANEVTVGTNPEGPKDLLGAGIAMAMAIGSSEFVLAKIKQLFKN